MEPRCIVPLECSTCRRKNRNGEGLPHRTERPLRLSIVDLLSLGLAEEFFVALGGSVVADCSFAARSTTDLFGSTDLTSGLRVAGHDDLLFAGSGYKEASATVQALLDRTQGTRPALNSMAENKP